MANNTPNQIVVSGYGCCCAAGNDLASTWRHLTANQVNISHDTGRYFGSGQKTPLFAVGRNNLAGDIIPFLGDSNLRGNLGEYNRTILLALTAVIESLQSANMSLTELQSKSVGVALGTTVGCTFNNEEYYIDWKEENTPDPSVINQYLKANLAEAVQRLLGVRGPRAVITNACSSGTDAIGLGKFWLETNQCDIVLAGGADELSRLACRGFNSLMLISQKPCRPFDSHRDGLTLGEGAGLLLMERENSLKKRKGRLYGFVRGYGTSCDAYHPTAPHPDGRGLQQAIRNALTDANILIDDISFINGHGTGTKANDIAETTALYQLGFKPEMFSMISTKGATGHTLGAAGGIEAVLTLRTLHEGHTNGSIGCQTQDPTLPVPILEEKNTRKLRGTIGMSQSLAFGGINGVVILEGMSS